MAIQRKAQTAKAAEEQKTAGISALPKTLDAEKQALAEMARAGEPMKGRRFQLHAANALYLAQEELERRTPLSGGLESRLPKMSRAKAVNSLMESEYFSRFCENQKNAEGMARLFEGERGATEAMRQFGAAIRQVEREKTLRQSAPAPERQSAGPLPEQSM